MKWIVIFITVLMAILPTACDPSPLPTEVAASSTPFIPPTVEAASATPASPIATGMPTSPHGPKNPPTVQDMPIVYYYFVALASKSAPAGSVVILADELVLGPTLSEIARNPDPVTNINSTLRAMIDDARNVWTSDNLGITSITLNNGAAHVALEGDIFGAGDIVLIAAREQIILTVFAEQAVQSAVITLNGENIASLGVSSGNGKPVDFAYTRADIEAFLAENAYSNPQ